MRQVRWKRGKYPGEIEATIGGKKYKIEKALDHNDRHKGEWKVMVWDRGDWEWETTEYGKANAKAWIMNKHGMKESTDWVCGKCNCDPCTCGEVNESITPHPEVVKAYKKTLDADDKAGDYNYRSNKARATRAANHLSKKINQHHPDLDTKGKIALRTKLQNMNEESPATSIGNASVALPPTARFKTIQVTDRRRRKDKHPVLLKRFRKYVEDKKDA